MISLDEFIKLHKIKNETFSDIFIALVNEDVDSKSLIQDKNNLTLKDTLLLEAIRFISKQKFGLELNDPEVSPRKVFQASYPRK